MVPDPVTGSLRTADARTVEIMQNTGDYVTFEGDWKIVRPKHFMLRQSSWVLRRWTWNAETGTMEWNEVSTLKPNYNRTIPLNPKRSSPTTNWDGRPSSFLSPLLLQQSPQS